MSIHTFRSCVRMFGITAYCDHIHRSNEDGEANCCRHEYVIRVHIWVRVFQLRQGHELPPHKHPYYPPEEYR